MYEMWRKNQKKVVAVSGGFDPVHIGHIKYFKEAKSLGDCLVVILNSDNFLKAKKSYVFMPFDERRMIIESIRYVDKVIPCIDEDQTVCKTLACLRPNIFAKGGDRTAENIPEYNVCKRLGIEMVFNVGGGKIQSSSWLVNESKRFNKTKDNK